MIIVRIAMKARVEKRTEMMQTLLSMIEPAGKEKGCLNYDVFCDSKDNHVFSLVEEWETREDLDRHIRSEKFGVLLGTKSLLAKPLEIKIHTVSHSEGTEVVNTLRDKGPSKRKSKEKGRALLPLQALLRLIPTLVSALVQRTGR